ncbi:PoNe immunity protein domain-containing protein [Massilia sp.]|uniref:PoNe immunity protein domain-containing protein n=1 Tax=Massilia sp. TaxID=1882437 RepID=UPI0028A04051|nr:PoNe immunity protein domain-containing protein [Massilia sp.]
MDNSRVLTVPRAQYDSEVDSPDSSVRWAFRQAEENPDNPYQYDLINIPKHLANGLFYRYARGDSLDSLKAHFYEIHIPTLEKAAAVADRYFPGRRIRSHFEQYGSWMLLAALVCFDDEGGMISRIDDWFTPDCNPALVGMVLKGFVKDFDYDRPYNLRDSVLPDEEGLVAILLQPRPTWERSLAAYMKQWPKRTKSYGYREHIDEHRYAFAALPLHLALVVCAFDVDDSAFRHLPHYPRDLVDYYRAHVRHARDAWRTAFVDPTIGLPESARPKEKKHYALTRAEAYARWVELICGEDALLIERARKALGKRKTMPPLDTAMEALAGVGLGINADLKDDETVFAHANSMCASWQLPAPSVPPMEQQGPARVTAILNALQALDLQRGNRLAVLESDSDNWNAVLYSDAHAAEFALLCEQLEITCMGREQWQ